MNKSVIILLCIALFVGESFTVQQGSAIVKPEQKKDNGLRILKQESFKRGEVLKYRLHYGAVNAGTVTIEVKDEAKEIGGRKTYHVIGLGQSKGAFDWVFKIRDRYESYIDEESLAPWIFIRRVDEGGYKIEQNYIFNHFTKKVDTGENKIFDVPQYCQDMISAFYYARSFDYTNAKVGDVFELSGFVDKEVFPIKIKFIGKETIKTDVGKINCLKFCPIVQKGRVFKKEEDLHVWITDDNNHVPVRAKAEILVGSIKMDLTEYSGLANPISKAE